MVSMTHEKFDELCEAISKMEYRADGFFPSIETIKKNLEPTIDHDIRFAIWLLETCYPPKTKEKKEARRYLMELVYSRIKFVD